MNQVDPAPAEFSTRRLSGFSLARQWRLTRKELAETLRDRRTIVTLVLMPILVYPLLAFVFRQFMATSLSPARQLMVVVGVEDDAMQTRLNRWLIEGDRFLQERKQAAGIEPPLVDEPSEEQIGFVVGDVEQLVREGRVDVGVRRVAVEDPRAIGYGVEIFYPEQSALAAGLRSFIERRIRAFNLALRRESGGATDSESGVSLVHTPITTKAAQRSLLPSVVPLVLLLMTITGAVYPAIDLTAGERERGTLEALVAAPVSRVGVLMAKYVAVLTVALLTAGMNLLAMSITLYSTGLSGLLVSPGENVWLLAAQMFGLLLLFASFFSAVLLAVTSFARSFKEAQAYLIPIMLVTLAPGLTSLSPTLELSGPLAVVPLVNVVLLARDVFSGDADPLKAVVVVVSTSLYAAVSIALAARIFGSDAILYGSSGTWSELLRRPPQLSDAPSLAGGLLCLAIVFAAMINVGGAGSLLAASAGPQAQLATSALLSVFVFAMIPLLAAAAEGVRVTDALRARAPSPRYWLGAMLLGLSAGVLVFELTVLGLAWNITTIGEELKQLVARKAAELNEMPVALVLVTLAVVPAMSEEILFRGYLFRALEVRWTPAATILVTAVAFGLFHTFGLSGLTLERLFPSLVLGILLGLVAYHSGSVWPPMILHALNNSLLLLIARSKDTLVQQGWLSAESEHVPGLWLAAAGAIAVVGLGAVIFPRSRR